MGERLADDIEVREATVTEKLILRHLIQLYSYDFSEFDGNDVDEFGLYPFDRLDYYWIEEKRHPYLVRVNGKWAGFALVIECLKDDDVTPFTFLAEFFILQKYRGKGIGQAVAFQLFDKFPGEWEVSEIPENYPAQAFWRKVIGRYVGGEFEEEIVEDGCVLQRFVGDRKSASASKV